MKNWTAIAALLMCNSGSAHQSSAALPDWCAGGRLRVVASFAFSASAVGEYADCRATGDCWEMEDLAIGRIGGPSNDNCVDCGDEHDDWTGAQRLAQNHCNLYARPADSVAIPDLGKVAIRVERPDSFHNTNHHGNAWQRQDISGYCLRCETPPQPVHTQPH